MRICFVCSGNICRSPTAEVVLRALADAAGRGELEIDSAGTGAWHAGEEMDRRSRATLVAAGYRPGRHEAKRFTADDLDDRDLVVALAGEHHRALVDLAARSDDPQAARVKIAYLRQFDQHRKPGDDLDVPDPYYGGATGFTDVLDQIERSCAALLEALPQAAATS